VLGATNPPSEAAAVPELELRLAEVGSNSRIQGSNAPLPFVILPTSTLMRAPAVAVNVHVSASPALEIVPQVVAPLTSVPPVGEQSTAVAVRTAPVLPINARASRQTVTAKSPSLRVTARSLARISLVD
jgi:hypothetical protein